MMVLQARELPNGHEFQFPGDGPAVHLIAEWTAGEHQCCPFFDIDLRLDRERWYNVDRLGGRPGTKEFIRADFKAWLKH